MSVSMVVAAGGTGGHLIPALAIADAVAARRPGAAIAFVGTRRGLETELVPAAGYRLLTTSMKPFSRSLAGVAAVASIGPAVVQARAILRRTRPAVVLGMGGYPSLPVVVAARTQRIPVLLHEQNAVPGLANSVGAKITGNVAVSFPRTVGSLRGARLVGLPVRDELRQGRTPATRAEAIASFDLASDRPTVLIFGGSLGARSLNRAATSLAQRWRDRDDVQLLVGAGRAHAQAVSAAMPDGKLVVRVRPYLERMDLAYAAADVVVCRAGASTVHELAVCGLPSILVPFPHARRREQDQNARWLVDAGASAVIADAELEGDGLGAMLEPMLADEQRRERMAAAARAVALPGAADEMAEWILRLAEGRDA